MLQPVSVLPLVGTVIFITYCCDSIPVRQRGNKLQK